MIIFRSLYIRVGQMTTHQNLSSFFNRKWNKNNLGKYESLSFISIRKPKHSFWDTWQWWWQKIRNPFFLKLNILPNFPEHKIMSFFVSFGVLRLGNWGETVCVCVWERERARMYEIWSFCCLHALHQTPQSMEIQPDKN